MSIYKKYSDTVQIAACMIKANSWTLDDAANKAKAELFKKGLLVHIEGLKNDIKNRADSMGRAELAWLTRNID